MLGGHVSQLANKVYTPLSATDQKARVHVQHTAYIDVRYKKLFKDDKSQKTMTKAVLQEVLDLIKPDDKLEKATMEHVEAFITRLNKILGAKAKVKLGGSFAKGTWLKGDHDVDLFVVFKGKADSDWLEKKLKGWKARRVHGSRHYFHIKDKVTFELVPVQQKHVNITDYSLGHVAWVNKKGNKDDIRLAKRFCKAAGVYGAESYLHGISGHVLDILVIHYKGFTKFVKAISSWKPQTVVDVNNTYKGKALQVMNTSKTFGPFVVVDPLQKTRNAAAALNQENYDKLVKHCKAYGKKPNTKLFTAQPLDYAKLAKQGCLVTLNAKLKRDKPDVARTKLVKAFEYLHKRTKEYGIKQAGIDWMTDTVWFVYKEKSKPTIEVIGGPPVKMEKHVKAFSKGRKTFVKAGRVWAKQKRTHTTPGQAIKQLLKDKYIKERVSTITCGKQSS